MSSTRTPYLISAAVHAAIFGALVWMGTGGTTKAAHDPSFFGTAAQDSSRGLATRRSALALGQSMPPSRAQQYLGRYVIASQGQPDTELVFAVVNDGDNHWSLVAEEGGFPAYKLVPIAPDSFVQQLDRARHVVFVRHDSIVTAVELSWRGKMRRGIKVTTKRD